MTTLTVAGADHFHGLQIAQALADHGAKVIDYVASPAFDATFSQVFPDAHRHDDAVRLAATTDADLIVTTIVADERAAVITAALAAGHDVVTNKPMCTTLEQLSLVRERAVATGHRCLTVFDERFNSRAIVRAVELARSGAIGEIVEMVGFGPHPHHPDIRAEWFYDRTRTGGILTDLGPHQLDQFLMITDDADVEIHHARVANVSSPERSQWNDVGWMTLTVGSVSAYGRVDWLSNPGRPAWGDRRLFLTGTTGSIEARPLVDVGGQGGPDHVFLVNDDTTGRVSCDDVELDWARRLLSDLVSGEDTLVSQEHCFRVAEVVLRAQLMAERRPSTID